MIDDRQEELAVLHAFDLLEGADSVARTADGLAYVAGK